MWIAASVALRGFRRSSTSSSTTLRPYARPDSGMNCQRPIAPTGDFARGLHALSWKTTAMSHGGALYFCMVMSKTCSYALHWKSIPCTRCRPASVRALNSKTLFTNGLSLSGKSSGTAILPSQVGGGPEGSFCPRLAAVMGRIAQRDLEV